jgi:oxysterol-binding protein 1
MRIAKLYMDPSDKERFEIQGKSSVKYHLKANHVVEAKRWFWALNNAIQWSKDQAKSEELRQVQNAEVLQQAKADKAERTQQRETDSSSILSRSVTNNGRNPAATGGVAEDEQSTLYDSYEPSVAGTGLGKPTSHMGNGTVDGDDDDDDYQDGGSSQDNEKSKHSKDAFDITAQSAKLQLDLLSFVSSALDAERTKNPDLALSDPTVATALTSYESAVRSLKGLIGDLLKISRDRDAYWQYRLDRETDLRQLWEDNMAQLAKEQENLEEKMEESEEKRKRTKRALTEALQGNLSESRPMSAGTRPQEREISDALGKVDLSADGQARLRRKSTARPTNIAEIQDLYDSESDDEEFFDAVDAGEIEVLKDMPATIGSPQIQAQETVQDDALSRDLRKLKESQIAPSFKGYENGPRQKLAMDADNRPKISLWVRCFHLIVYFGN